MKLTQLILIIVFISSSFARQFSEDIIVDSSSCSEIAFIVPVINVDRSGKIGISWTDEIDSNFTVYYRQSSDHGYTFEPKLVIDDIPVGERKRSYGVYFDRRDDILILHYDYSFPWYYYYKMSKSTDGGLSFFPLSLNELNFYPVSQLAIIDDSTYFLPLVDPNNSNIIKIMKSFDNGLNFNGRADVQIDSGAIHWTIIPIFKLENEDIICFWGSKYQHPIPRNGIFSSRSTDGGITFGSKSDILGTEINAGLPSVDVYENYLFLTYNSTDSNSYPNVWVTVSENYGHTFSTPKLIYQHQGWGNFAPQPTIKFNPNVGLCLIWSKPSVYNPYIYFTHSRDFGNTFESTIIVTNGSMRVTNSLAVSDSGYVYVVCAKDNPSRIVLNRAQLPLLTGIKQQKQDLKSGFLLHHNHPNPFNPVTVISWELAGSSQVKLTVYNLLGQKVAELLNERRAGGFHSIEFDGSRLSSGVYLYRLEAGGYVQCRKMILMR